MKDKHRILIVGATGFCGNGVLSSLSDDSVEIYAHIRPESSALQQTKDICMLNGHTAVICALQDLDKEIGRIQPDIVCSFIGTTKRKMKVLNSSYHEIDYGINHSLIEMLTLQNIQPLFVYVSSMGIEWHRWSSYLQARHLVETELAQSNLPYVILRPGLLSGPTRLERRPSEEIGEVLSRLWCNGLDRLGLRDMADGSRPLNANQIGQIVEIVVHEWIEAKSPLNHRLTIEVSGIHSRLRDR